jgi:hypothetical protein
LSWRDSAAWLGKGMKTEDEECRFNRQWALIFGSDF